MFCHVDTWMRMAMLGDYVYCVRNFMQISPRNDMMSLKHTSFSSLFTCASYFSFCVPSCVIVKRSLDYDILKDYEALYHRWKSLQTQRTSIVDSVTVTLRTTLSLPKYDNKSLHNETRTYLDVYHLSQPDEGSGDINTSARSILPVNPLSREI